MALIFLQSSQAGVLGDLGVFNLILSSAAHMLMFGLLTAVLWWMLRPVTGRALLIAVVLAALYGVSDEIHQSFVATRTASFADIGFDVLGAALAALLIRRSRSPGGQGGPRPRDSKTHARQRSPREPGRVPAPGAR